MRIVEVAYLTESVTDIDEGVFFGCDELSVLHYEGTMSEWEIIRKDRLWSNGLYNVRIICSDTPQAR